MELASILLDCNISKVAGGYDFANFTPLYCV